VNMAHGEMVEKELDTMMVRRAKKAEKTQARERSCGRLNAPADVQAHPAHVRSRPQAPRAGNTIPLDTIGRTRMEQEADKA
jgi:hypothetical protein